MYGELTKQSGNYPHIITTESFEKTRMIVGRNHCLTISG